MELINLHDFIENTIAEFNSEYFSQDKTLPDSFKEYVKSHAGGEKFTFFQYTTVVRTDLSIYCPNQWFYIAAYYCKLYPVLKQYKDAVYENAKLPESLKDYQSFFGGVANNYEKAKDSFSGSNLTSEQVDLLSKFMSDYQWWRGGKGIERNDFYYSPILSSAALVNQSQSYVAEICKYLVENPVAWNILLNAIQGKTSVVSKSLAYESTVIVEFMGTCVKRFLQYDENFSTARFKANSLTLGIPGCYVGKLLSAYHNTTDPRHIDDFDTNITWETNGQTYCFYKQQNIDSLNAFKDYFNILYKGKFEIIIDGAFYRLYELSVGTGLSQVRDINKGLQTIYFGAPGTGKSYAARQLTFDKPHIRTIFHPDSDYASFVGCYKPVMEGGQIKYKYRPQAFVNAYINAWLTDEPYYLVIEEINRGNCAQIFGDIFQLLDRTAGDSDYEVHPDTDLQNYIAEEFAKEENQQALADKNGITPDEIVSGKVMRLPQNLNIIATMNTSDQSLFPMDSAFKRRWNWKYFSIKDESKGYTIKLNEGGQEYDWWKTIEALNEKILAITKSADKQLGYWFAKLPDGESVISPEQFVSKVIFYLWNDVFKDYNYGDSNAFTPETTFDKFFDSEGNVVEDTIVKFMARNYPEDETPSE